MGATRSRWDREPAPPVTPHPELPACCRGCELFEAEAGQCLLLAHPTEENRRHLLTMPCNVQELLARRFRGHDPDVAREALVSWLDPEWSPEDLRATYGHAPLDARLWLTSWPYLYLGRNAVRRQWRNTREQPWSEPPAPLSEGEEDPTLPGRVVRALEAVRAVDPVGYAMMVELMRGELDVATWRSTLGVSDATVTDRKYLAVYRYSVVFFDILPQLESRSQVALTARRFTPGDPTDADALETVRHSLRRPGFSLTEFRELYRAAAASSLERLADIDALGEETMKRYDGAFRRVLRIEDRDR